ncbi:MAG: hypothetical protein FWG68_08965 [Defluviitaleaceae bacterium]|nr:hypothetical protein [Defluviitaleaceae bacterium]
MYEILKNPQEMTRAEVEEKYNGKWLFIIKVNGNPFEPYVNEIPVVVADEEWEGDEDGIYDKYYNDPNIKVVSCLSLLPQQPHNLFGFWEVPADDCD